MARIGKPIKVTRVECTCTVCPSQWRGWTDDGRQIYVRYRWEHLNIRVGKPGDVREFAAVGGQTVFEIDGSQWCMTYGELKEVTEGVIEWPEKEEVSNAKTN